MREWLRDKVMPPVVAGVILAVLMAVPTLLYQVVSANDVNARQDEQIQTMLGYIIDIHGDVEYLRGKADGP